MAWHEWAIIETLPPCRVAVHRAGYPVEDITNRIDIGPLFPLFNVSARETCAHETGAEANQAAVDRWMGPTRFHLPPTIRWLCCVERFDGETLPDEVEVWMACSERVVLGDYDEVRTWEGGCFAAVESTFDTPVTASWQNLRHLLNHHNLTPIGERLLIENLQATSHGGWDRYRVLVAVDAVPWNERRQVAAG